MNRQKLATIGCIILSIVFSLSLGLFSYFKVFLPYASNIYEKTFYYPDDLYEEYQKEAEGMIEGHEYVCQYTFYREDGQTTLVIESGEYDEEYIYSNYLTAKVKNFGTNKQEVTFERGRKAPEQTYEKAQRRYIALLSLIFILIFTVALIKSSIKRLYKKVFYIMACMTIFTVILHFVLV